MNDTGGQVWTLLGLGDITQATDDLEAATQYYRRARELAELVGDMNAAAWAAMNSGEILARHGFIAPALSQLCHAIKHFEVSRYWFGLIMSVAAGSYIAWLKGEHRQAQHMLNALDHKYQSENNQSFTESEAVEHVLFFNYIQLGISQSLVEDTIAPEQLLTFEDALAEAQRLARQVNNTAARSRG